MRQNGHPVAGTLIARILVVPLCQGYRRWPHEHRVKADHRAGGITQRAIDAHAVLLVLLQLFRSLQEFALAQRRLFLPDQPWFDRLELN